MQPHIIAKHPEFVMDRETDSLPNPTKTPKTDNGGETTGIKAKLSPEVKPEDSISDEIKQIKAEKETLINKKEDLEKKPLPDSEIVSQGQIETEPINIKQAQAPSPTKPLVLKCPGCGHQPVEKHGDFYRCPGCQTIFT